MEVCYRLQDWVNLGLTAAFIGITLPSKGYPISQAGTQAAAAKPDSKTLSAQSHPPSSTRASQKKKNVS
jgi:hypothetical protein